MTKKYYHRKLIRDLIPKLIKASGGEFKTRVMRRMEFEKELKKKLLEEVKEAIKAKKDELPNELADVLEIIKTMASHYKISFNDIQKTQIEKSKKRGGFKKKLFLIWSTGKPGR